MSQEEKKAVAAYQSEYRARNRESLLESKREWHRENKERIRVRRTNYCRQRRINEPEYRLYLRVSCLVRASLRGKKKGRRLEELLGYTISELANHLQTKFHSGMSWENAGKWHIDHIVPLSHFQIAGEDDPAFRKAWALGNLQPLWAADNLAKGARMPVTNHLGIEP